MSAQLHKVKVIIALLVLFNLYNLVDYGHGIIRFSNLIQERNTEDYRGFINFYLSLNWESYINPIIIFLKIIACALFIISKYNSSKLLRAILLFELLITNYLHLPSTCNLPFPKYNLNNSNIQSINAIN